MRVLADRGSWFVFAGLLAFGACDGAASPGLVPSGPVVPKPTTPTPPPVAAREIYKVPLGDSPARGAEGAKVTLVAFSEFQCPYCARVVPTLDQLATRYGDDLRIVFKHLPLPFHERALPAALAAEAAHADGKFWSMHDQLFAKAGALGAEDLQQHARTVGLDVPRFSGRLDDAALKARVDNDLKLAETLGVRGTPTFFVNGRKLVGAVPLDAFVKLIDEERARADEKLRAGVSRAGLYAALTDGGIEKVAPGAKPAGQAQAHCQPPPGQTNCAPGAAPRAAADDPSNDPTVHKIDLGAAPVRGPKDAPITLVLFSDFECPFCKRIEGTIAELEKAYPGKIRVAWKNFPLGFHENARPAALAALAAQQGGKFWQMHAKLIENQGALDAASLERYAGEIGVDRGGLKAAMGRSEHTALIEADLKQAAALGVSGTPTVFVNGRRVVGARPVETFRAIIDQELAKKGG